MVGNKKIINAIKNKQINYHLFARLRIDVRAEAAKKLVEISGLEGAKVFFTNAGAEANENAIKMAKLVQENGRSSLHTLISWSYLRCS